MQLFTDAIQVLDTAGIVYLIFLGHGIPTAVLNDLSSIFAPKPAATTVVVTPTVHTETTTAAPAAA